MVPICKHLSPAWFYLPYQVGIMLSIFLSFYLLDCTSLFLIYYQCVYLFFLPYRAGECSVNYIHNCKSSDWDRRKERKGKAKSLF